MNKFKKLLHIFAITLLVMTSTLFIPVTVYTPQQERNIQFGFPVSFVSMDSSYSMVEMNGESFDYYLTNPRQHPMYIIGDGFVISFLIWFIPIALLFLLFNRFIKNYRIFEIFLTGFLFLFTIISFFKFTAEMFIILLLTTLITQLLNEYIEQVK